MKKIKQSVMRFIGYYVLYISLNFLCSTLKINIKNDIGVKRFFESKTKFVLAFWHGTMLVPWYYHRNKSFAALISKSKDGTLLERVLKPWKYNVVRGSSNDGGKNALSVLVELAKKNNSIAITPDGPKGPAMKLKPGAVITAKRADIPLVLLGVGYKKKRTLKSWDKFQIPGIFSDVNLVYSDPIYIDQNLSYESTSTLIKECEIKLNELQKEAAIFLN